MALLPVKVDCHYKTTTTKAALSCYSNKKSTSIGKLRHTKQNKGPKTNKNASHQNVSTADANQILFRFSGGVFVCALI